MQPGLILPPRPPFWQPGLLRPRRRGVVALPLRYDSFQGGGGQAPPASGPAARAFADNGDSQVAGVTHQFPGTAFGPAAVDRYLVFNAWTNVAGRVVNAMTIGGVSAAQILAHNTNSSMEIWGALVPTGTSGTVAVTWDASAFRTALLGYAVTGYLSTTPVDTAVTSTGTITSASIAASIDAPEDGVVVAFFARDANPADITFAGVTEDFDQTFGTNRRYACGSEAFPSASAGLSVTASYASALAASTKLMALSFA